MGEITPAPCSRDPLSKQHFTGAHHEPFQMPPLKQLIIEFLHNSNKKFVACSLNKVIWDEYMQQQKSLVMLCQSSMTRSWMVQGSCAGGKVLWVAPPYRGEGGQETWLCACPAHGTGGEQGCPPPLGSSGNSAAAGQRCDSGKQDPQLPTTTSWWIEWVKIYDLPSQLHCLWHN